MFSANYDALSERGRAQARRLGQVMSERLLAAERPGFDAVFTGPAVRHVDTAALAGEPLRAAGLEFPEPVVVPGLDEHDGQGMVRAAMAAVARGDGARLGLGPELAGFAATAMDGGAELRERSRAWQRLFEAVMRRWFLGGIELEGVESWAAFHRRVREAFLELRALGRGEVFVVTSVGPVGVILLEVLGVGVERAFEQAWRLYNTGVTRVIYGGGRVTLDGYNDVGHLGLREWTHR